MLFALHHAGEQQMYSLVTVKDVVRIPPSQFGNPIEKVALEHLRQKYEGVLDREIGFILAVVEIDDVGIGRLLPGDGATYHEIVYKVIAFKPLKMEVIEGEVVEIVDFGIFIKLGPLDGLCHMSQICDDFISYDHKRSVMVGKKTGRIVQEGDLVRARIATISLDTGSRTGKLGLTMRQPFLGKLEWIEEEIKKLTEEPEEVADDEGKSM